MVNNKILLALNAKKSETHIKKTKIAATYLLNVASAPQLEKSLIKRLNCQNLMPEPLKTLPYSFL